MEKCLYCKEKLKHMGLITNGYCLPYNPNLTQRAKELKENMTEFERKLWDGFLKKFVYKITCQKQIDNYIVDFYCNKLKLVIEIDGEIHENSNNKEYNLERTKVLEAYRLKVLRFTNKDIEIDFENVCKKIMEYGQDPLAPLNEGTEGLRR